MHPQEPEPSPAPRDPSSKTGQETDRQDPPSKEEQMEAFEDSLKEDDWGHQPC